MECLASQAKSSHVKASIKTMIKLLTCDQGPAFQAHSLQITLLGPITHEPNVILGLLNNRVLTISNLDLISTICAFHQRLIYNLRRLLMDI